MGRWLYPSLAAAAPILAFGLAPLAAVFGHRRSRRVRLAAPHRVRRDDSNGRELLDAEIARARRYEQDVAIVVLQLEPGTLAVVVPPRADDASESAVMVPFEALQSVFAHLGLLLRQELRENDVVTYDAREERFVLALPHTGGEGAQVAAERLLALAHERAALRVRAGAAAFPGDGLVLDDLVAAACKSRPRSDVAEM